MITSDCELVNVRFRGFGTKSGQSAYDNNADIGLTGSFAQHSVRSATAQDTPKLTVAKVIREGCSSARRLCIRPPVCQ